MEYELGNDKFKHYQINEIKLSNGINLKQDLKTENNIIDENFDYK